MIQANDVLKVADGISNFGLAVILSASFIVLSLLMWVAIFQWFKSIINKMIDDNTTSMGELLNETKKQNELSQSEKIKKENAN